MKTSNAGAWAEILTSRPPHVSILHFQTSEKNDKNKTESGRKLMCPLSVFYCKSVRWQRIAAVGYSFMRQSAAFAADCRDF